MPDSPESPKPPKSPKKSGAFLKLIMVFLAIALAAAFLILPRKLLDGLVNQDLDDPFFASIRTNETTLAPLLDRMTFKGVTLIPRATPERPLTIAEISVSGLDRWKLVKALLGFGEELFQALENGELLVRELSDNGPLGDIYRIRVGSLSLQGLSIELLGPGEAPVNFDFLKIASLKVTGLDLASTDGRAVAVDGLSLFNLAQSVIGGVVVSDLVYVDNADLAVDLEHASVSGVSVPALSRALSSRRISRIMDLLGSFAGIDLASLGVSLGGEETFHLDKALVDALGDGDAARRVWRLDGLTLHLDQFALDPSAPPGLAAVWYALGPILEADILFEAGAGGASSLKIASPGIADMDFALSATGLGPGALDNAASMLLSATGIGLGEGRLEIRDRGLAPRLLPNLALLARAYHPIGAGGPAPEAAPDPAPDPAPDSAPDSIADAAPDSGSEARAAGPAAPPVSGGPDQAGAPAAGDAPGGSDGGQAQAPTGDEVDSLVDRAFDEVLGLQAAASADSPPAPADPASSEAADPAHAPPGDDEILLYAFDRWLSSWEDPDPNRAVLNAPILSLEMGRLIANPGSIAVRWDPPPPGFPQNLLARIGGTAKLLGLVVGGGADWPALAAQYKYDIIQSLNLTLEVNDRAPVAVYLPPSGAKPQ